MLNATNLYLQYGDRILLDHIDMVIKSGDRIGLVGRNGAGKSTVLKILAGELVPDQGDISRPSNSTMGFLHQEIQIEQEREVLEETLTAFDELKSVNEKIDHINSEIAIRTDYHSEGYMRLLEKLSELTDRYSFLGGDSSEGSAVKVLKGLGFKESDFKRKIHEFSGGWQMRIVLAKMLLKQPDYLLLDEPTNHLDIESIIWLERFLSSYPGAIILISHDQKFLDNCTNRTIEIELGRTQDYKAPYTKYLELRKDRKEKQLAAFSNQQKLITQKERTIKRFMAKATKTSMAQSMQKQLDKLERVQVAPEDLVEMNLKFPPSPRSGAIVLDAHKIQKSYGSLNVLDNIDLRIERGDRVSFVGQNGQGKTTLAKILVESLAYEGGKVEKGHNVSIGYYAQNQAETLDGSLTLLETMENHSPAEMRSKLRNILGAFLFSGEDVDKKVSVLSGGERARLALACMLLKPFNLLVLDEPTNHLDILAKKVLKKALMQYDGTLIIVSHDREFLSDLTKTTVEFREKKIYTYLGDVNYFLQKRQLNNLREVEMYKGERKPQTKPTKPSKPSKPSKVDLNPDQKVKKKELARKVENSERKIGKLEKELELLHAQMVQPGFYENESSESVLALYREKKKALSTMYDIWEESQEQLELIGH